MEGSTIILKSKLMLRHAVDFESLRKNCADLAPGFTQATRAKVIRFTSKTMSLICYFAWQRLASKKKYGHRVVARNDQPALTQIGYFRNVVRLHKEIARIVSEEFPQIRFLDLVPDLMRRPAFPGQLVLGDNGQNLPTVLQEICRKKSNKDVLTEWIRELTPMDVVDLHFPKDSITGQLQMLIVESGDREVSAYSASDGTLRFLAMLAALLAKGAQGLFFFEEIDNGIHPARLRLLIELIESQASQEQI